MAGGINQFMTGEAIKPFLANMPNYANLFGNLSNNALQGSKGILNNDVVNQISQSAAERGVGTGMTGGANFNTALLRAIGTNSYGLQQDAQKNFSQLVADTPVPQLFNPASLIVPTILGNQERAAAQSGMGGGGGGGTRITGMPNLSARFATGGPLSVSAASNGPALSGPSWATGSLSNPAQLSSDWWDSYGGTSLSSSTQSPQSYFGDMGQFAEEDNYFDNPGINEYYDAPDSGSAWDGYDAMWG